MNNSKRYLDVFLENEKVGTLAEINNHLVAFEYSDEWLNKGYSINPFSLPLKKEVFIPKKYETFEGLFGVFADSLPDGWGRLLVDRFLLKNHVNPESISPIERLAIVGNNGMGAVEYRPQYNLKIENSKLSLDELAIECKKVFESKKSKYLDKLYQMGGSSGGARPKVFYEIDNEEWIAKFPSSLDKDDIGQQEYEYSLCAKKCGIFMAETKLLHSDLCSGYFATKRFDRENGKKIHMVSVSGLLETSHRIPNLDYSILMRLTLQLTRSYEEMEKLFRLMCFNIFAHNRDDHSKNFSYLYKNGVWRLSPAYDLTYSNSIGGEHATTVNGNGINPSINDILEVAKLAKLDEKKVRLVAKDIKEQVYEDLGKYL
jgi:hypothetical protein